LPGEFELIARYFAPLAAGAPGAFNLSDDVAVVEVGPGEQLAVKADAIVAGVHFLPADPPDLIARKLLRVNLSDLAGKGARPLGYLLTCAISNDVDEAWLAKFVDGLGADQREFGLSLLGGDTTATPGPLTLSATVFGAIAKGRLPWRGAAQAGDAVLVSGTLGDGALGLDVQRQEFPELDAAGRAELVDRYRLPRPRLKLGRALVEAGLVHAAMDISDGLLADLGHICATSKLGADIEWPRVPLSEPAAKLVAARPLLRERIVAGGDDYELLLTVAEGDVSGGARDRAARGCDAVCRHGRPYARGRRRTHHRRAGQGDERQPHGLSAFLRCASDSGGPHGLPGRAIAGMLVGL
jgi:thiamine-monophosphate kinase